MTFDRGFKAWAERSAVSIRIELGLKDSAPLSAEQVASYLGVAMLSPDEIPGISAEICHQLMDADRDGWSAISFLVGQRAVVIYNSTHSLRRQASDKMHELAHFFIGHDPAKIVLSQDGGIIMRSYDQKQEDEAVWLSGCLLLPRPALLWIKHQKLEPMAVCKTYCVSEQLLRFRMNVGGVNLQVHRAKKT